MFKSSGIFITAEELHELNTAAYPGIIAGDLLCKYYFPVDAGIDRETGEVFFDCEEV